MFYGGTIEQWIQIGLYMLFMIMLFTGVVTLSYILSNKVLHKKRKNNFKAKNKKKSYFIDVA